MSRRPPRAPGRRATLRTSLAALVAAAAACDIPTDLPVLQQSWTVPIEGTSIGLAEFLPGGVTDDGTAFTVTVDSSSVVRTLGELCVPCADADGLTVPKPAFDASVEWTVGLPAEVVSANLESATGTVRLTHGFSFDPIRPGATPGRIVVTVRDADGSRVLGSVVVDGVDTAFPAGTELVETIDLAPGAVGSTFRSTVDVESPAGDPITIDASQRLTVATDATTVRVTAVRLAVGGRTVDLSPVALDVEGLDADLVDDVERGAIEVTVANPFGVGMDATVVVDGPTMDPITKPLSIGADATSVTSIDFTGDELRSFLGQPGVTLAGSGVVADTPGVILVTPGQSVELSARLDVTLNIGG